MPQTLATPALVSALYFAETLAFHILAGAIDQPYTVYAEGNWFTHRIGESAFMGLVVAVAMFVIVSIDLAVQYMEGERSPKNTAYHAYLPRIRNIRSWLLSPEARMTIVIGLLCLAAFYASTAIEVFRVRQFAGGLVWPPETLFAVFMLAWGLLWIADCLVRPKHETMIAAILYIMFVLLFVLPSGSGMLRE
jgi:hypothetical protein